MSLVDAVQVALPKNKRKLQDSAGPFAYMPNLMLVSPTNARCMPMTQPVGGAHMPLTAGMSRVPIDDILLRHALLWRIKHKAWHDRTCA